MCRGDEVYLLSFECINTLSWYLHVFLKYTSTLGINRATLRGVSLKLFINSNVMAAPINRLVLLSAWIFRRRFLTMCIVEHCVGHLLQARCSSCRSYCWRHGKGLRRASAPMAKLPIFRMGMCCSHAQLTNPHPRAFSFDTLTSWASRPRSASTTDSRPSTCLPG